MLYANLDLHLQTEVYGTNNILRFASSFFFTIRVSLLQIEHRQPFPGGKYSFTFQNQYR